MQEIERKFLISPENIPISLRQPIHIEQFYIQIDPEIRFRKEVLGYSENRYYYKTEKNKTTNPSVREENETKIEEDDYYDNMPRKVGQIIQKKRYVIQLLDNYWAYYDNYDSGLNIIEVEFGDTEVADEWIPPEWFGEEVTGIDEYKGVNIATK